MIILDLQDRTYTAEVLLTRKPTAEVAEKIAALGTGHRTREAIEEAGNITTLFHGFTQASGTYHRSTRSRSDTDGQTIEVPRQRGVGARQRFLYDVVVAQRGRHTLVAVPFHGLAEEFFPKVDRELAGTKTAYQKLDISKIVLALGRHERVAVKNGSGSGAEIGVTRCQLAYSDVERRRDLQTVHMSGLNLGATAEYRFLIEPVIGRARDLVVTPVVLGFSLVVDGVKKASATTDRHGNFKLFVAPGLRQILRLFKLLETVEMINGVASTTTNLPILQARSIREEASE